MDEKARLRTEIQQRRDHLTATERNAASARIRATCLSLPALGVARSVFVYISTELEVDTHLLIDHLLASRRTVLVPRVHGRMEMLAVPFPGWPHLQPGVFQILTPPAAPAWSQSIDLVFVPGVAFSVDGLRLGYGGGYYDRWLAAHPGTFAVGLAFDVQITNDLPTSSHDIPVPLIITESRLLGYRADSPT